MDAGIDALAAEHGFSGVVSIDRRGEVEVRRAYGSAHRAYGVPTTVDTRFAIASGTKGFTALAVAGLVERGVLALDTPARSLLGNDLPLIRDDATVAHLLGHTSGIGDYLDEAAGWEPADHVLPVPVHRLATAEDHLAVLDGFPTAFPPGDRFAYCNGGYVVLALVAERAAGTPYHDLVRDTVLRPAGMADSGFFRSDELPARTATGYLSPTRTNVLHLPVRGVGDGGLFTTAADPTAFWAALFAGRVVSADLLAELVRPRTEDTGEPFRYGLGFWLQRGGPAVVLEGMDAGVSFRSVHDPHTLSRASAGRSPWAGPTPAGTPTWVRDRWGEGFAHRSGRPSGAAAARSSRVAIAPFRVVPEVHSAAETSVLQPCLRSSGVRGRSLSAR